MKAVVLVTPWSKNVPTASNSAPLLAVAQKLELERNAVKEVPVRVFPRGSKAQPCGSRLPCGASGGDVPWGVSAKPGHGVWMWRFAHLPLRRKTAQPSGSFPTKKRLPRRVTLHRACGGFRSRQDSRYVSSATTNLRPPGKKQSLPFTCRPTRGGVPRMSGLGGSGSMNTTLGGNAVPFTR